jgi:hypothetical protein
MQDATFISVSDAMFEYVFFDEPLRERFISYLKERKVECQVLQDQLGMIVEVSEDLPEELSDDIDCFYDALEREQVAQSKEAGELQSLASFRFKLPDGQSRMLPLETEFANRLLASFSLEEIQGLLEEAARCTLEPSEEHLCRILRAKSS